VKIGGKGREGGIEDGRGNEGEVRSEREGGKEGKREMDGGLERGRNWRERWKVSKGRVNLSQNLSSANTRQANGFQRKC
jgi:hypothetical protein